MIVLQRREGNACVRMQIPSIVLRAASFVPLFWCSLSAFWEKKRVLNTRD